MYIHIRNTILALLLGSSSLCLFAQPGTEAGNPSTWFADKLFYLTDRNQDGFLDPMELGNTDRLMEYFLDKKQYDRADLDHNQLLDKDEFSYRIGKALVFRLEQDEKELVRLDKTYPYFSEAKLKYFKRQPDLTAQLANNLVWMRAHLDLAQKILLDKAWLKEHPHILVAMHQNFVMLTEEPSLAKKLYKHKTSQTNRYPFRDFRMAHQEYLEAKPAAASVASRLDFPYIPPKSVVIKDVSAPTPTPSRSTASLFSGDSLQKVITKERAAHQKEIASLKARIRTQDSLRTKLQREMPTSGNFQDMAALQKAYDQLLAQEQARRIEQQLARLVEDSLLAQTIRQKRQVRNLNIDLKNTQATLAKLSNGSGQDSLLQTIARLQTEQRTLKTAYDKASMQLSSLQLTAQSNRQQGAGFDSLKKIMTSLESRYEQRIADLKQDVRQAENEHEQTRQALKKTRLQLTSNIGDREMRDSLARRLAEMEAKYEQKLNSLNQEYRLLSKANEESQKALIQAHKQIAELNQKPDNHDELERELAEQKAKYQQDIDALAEQNRKLRQYREEAQAELLAAQQEIAYGAGSSNLVDSLIKRINVLDASYRQALVQREQFAQKNKAMNAKGQALSRQLKTLKAEQATWLTEKQNWVKREESLGREMDQMRTDIAALSRQQEKQTGAADEEKIRLSRQVDFLLAENQKLGQSHDALVQSRQALADSLSQVYAMQSSMKNQVADVESSYKQSLAAKDWQVEKARKEMNRRQLAWHQQRDSLTRVIEDLATIAAEAKESHDAVMSAAAVAGPVSKENVNTSWRKDQKTMNMRLEELTYENEKLREHLEWTLNVAGEKEEILEKRLMATLKENDQLRNKNDRLKRKVHYKDAAPIQNVEQMLTRLEQANAEIVHLEQANKGLFDQLQASEQYLQGQLQENQHLKRKLKRKVSQVSAERTEKEGVQKTLSSYERNNWEDSLSAYRLQIRDIKRKYASQDDRFRVAITQASLTIDSLEHHIAVLEGDIQMRSQMNTLDVRRIRQLEDKEKSLERLQVSLLEQIKLMNQRQEMLKKRKQELDKQEEKYQILKEWEKALHLKEARLNVRTDKE
ncbi:MAG: hypothetical protein AAFR61_14460 [Bacteroidota bacterium]